MGDHDKFLRVGVYGILTRENQISMIKTQLSSRSIYNFPGADCGEAQSLLSKGLEYV